MGRRERLRRGGGRWNAKVMLHGNGRGDMWWPTSDVEKMTEAYHQLCAHFRDQNMIPGSDPEAVISRAPSTSEAPSPKILPLAPAFSRPGSLAHSCSAHASHAAADSAGQWQ